MTLRSLALLFAASSLAASARAQTPGDADTAMTAAAMESMSRPMTADPHMRMTESRSTAPGDSARAVTLIATVRLDLVKYRNVDSALADGFRPFHPEIRQPVYHYTNLGNALEARMTFDPAHPTSLLYRKNADGTFTLTGVMYTAPRRLTMDQLDQRVPLSITHWHEHTNWCVPPAGARERWLERKDGVPVFGPHSAIATKEGCDAVGGRFLPRIFNWMVHVNAFASDDPAVIWSGDHH
ncbi:MAG: hypothetical protein ACHQXA_08395 [Gemmatimonadales bacterium]